MDWKDVAGAVGKAAPIIGGLLGGPAAPITAAVGAIVASALGTDNNPEAVHAALQSDPDALVKLREAEMTHKLALERLKLEEPRMLLADRQDARARDVAIQQATGRNLRADVLAWAAIGGLVATILLVFFVEVPAGPARDILLLLAGALIAIVKDVYGFEFGSSAGSKNKDGILARLSGPAVPTTWKQ